MMFYERDNFISEGWKKSCHHLPVIVRTWPIASHVLVQNNMLRDKDLCPYLRLLACSAKVQQEVSTPALYAFALQSFVLLAAELAGIIFWGLRGQCVLKAV